MTRHFIILLALLAASPALATEVILRNRVEARGSVVLLGDVAEIKTDDETLRNQLAATPLIPTPAAGTQQYLRLAEIRDLVASRGVDVRDMRFGGTVVVAVTPEPAAGAATAPERRQPVRPVIRTEQEIQLAAERFNVAVKQYVQQQTGHELWNVKVEGDSKLVDFTERLGDSIRLSGGEAPWTGRQRLTLLGPANEPLTLVYARVERLEMAVFAIQPIKRGDLIRRSDVELRPHLGALPSQSALSLDAVVGHEAVQGIRPDSIVQTNQLRSPVIVRRNERVSVRARAAGVSVQTYAMAQQDGGMGDLVMVQSLASKERYAARVIGIRELEIFTAGASAAEIAASPTPAQ
jgi:flagella basal body P-ring formation protein FlgA